jgi:predicted HAD superfamily Cof-like phosphohydrolase
MGERLVDDVRRDYDYEKASAIRLIDDVRDFHVACDIPISDKPQIPDAQRVQLRLDLINEEGTELFEACARGDIVGIADGIIDLVYVTLGMALEFGIPFQQVWDEVQNSNMRKRDPATGKVRRREDGKILKPEGWTPPDIAGVLAR